MPGIVGIIASGDRLDQRSALQRMLDCTIHEKFYTSGTYVSEELGIFLGWSNRPGTFSDSMPQWNERRDVCMVFYGEDFADEQVVNGLKKAGHRCDAATASYLVHLYEEREKEFFELLNGWFCGVVVDLRKGEATLFNDRYGMQRVYYHQCPEGLYFSSEAKALLRVLPKLRNLDPQGLGEFMSFGCVLENRSLFTEVSLLPPGSAWRCRCGTVNKQRYFLPETWESQSALPKEEFYTSFKDTFVKVLPKYLRARNAALSLTGGLDTRMILAHAQLSRGELPCYTFGGMYNDCYDVKISRQIASLRQQEHRVLPVDAAFFRHFPELAEKTVYITDGNLDVTGSPDLYVNRQARLIAPVRITGNYGSEILRGARHLKAQPALPGLFTGEFAEYVSLAADTLALHCRDHRVSFAAFKQVPWYHHNRLSLEQSQITLRSPYLDNELVGLMYRAPAEVLDSSELSLRLIRDGNPGLGAIMTDRGIGGNAGYLASNLARLYREFLFKADYAFDYGMPRCCAAVDRFLFAPLGVEKIFLGRHKFYHFRVWYRDELAAYVKEILLDRKSLGRAYLNPETVRKIVADHTSGRLNYTTEITNLLTAELLQRLVID